MKGRTNAGPGPPSSARPPIPPPARNPAGPLRRRLFSHVHQGAAPGDRRPIAWDGRGQLAPVSGQTRYTPQLGSALGWLQARADPGAGRKETGRAALITMWQNDGQGHAERPMRTAVRRPGKHPPLRTRCTPRSPRSRAIRSCSTASSERSRPRRRSVWSAAETRPLLGPAGRVAGLSVGLRFRSTRSTFRA